MDAHVLRGTKQTPCAHQRSLSDVRQALWTNEGPGERQECLDDLQGELRAVQSKLSVEDRRLLDEHATFVREMEQDLKSTPSKEIGHAVPPIEPAVKERNDKIPRISKMQIEFWSRASPPTLPGRDNSVHQIRRWRKMHWVGVKKATTTVAQAGQ